MQCPRCGSQILCGHTSCALCGLQLGPPAQVRQMPPPQWQPAPRPGIPVKWILLGLWLAIALAGWVAAVLLAPIQWQPAPAPTDPDTAWRPASTPSLTDGTWYQYDPESSALNAWQFGDALATFGPAEGSRRQQVDYFRSEANGDVTIGYVSGSMTWVWDAREGCFWHCTTIAGQSCKIRIFAADAVPEVDPAFFVYPAQF